MQTHYSDLKMKEEGQPATEPAMRLKMLNSKEATQAYSKQRRVRTSMLARGE